MFFTLLLPALAMFTPTQADTYPPYTPPLPIPCTGEGCTVSTGNFLDCNVLQHQNGTFFRISASNGTGVGLTLATAPTLEGTWTLQTPVLNDYSKFVNYNASNATSTHLWTPELHYNGSMYILYYAMNNEAITAQFDIRVATSPTMADNSWTDHGPLGIPPSPIWKITAPNGTVVFRNNIYAKIDASVLTNYSTGLPSNQLVFGDEGSGLFGVQLNNSGLTAMSTPVMYIQNEPRGFEVDSIQSNPNMTGLSYFVAMNSYIYNFYSSGSCCEANSSYGYWTGVCRSAPTLPYVFFDKNGLPCAGNSDGSINNSGSTFLDGNATVNPQTGRWAVAAPGSIGIVKTSSGPVITYEYSNRTHSSGYKVFGHNYLNFTSDGWPYLSTAPRGNNIGL